MRDLERPSRKAPPPGAARRHRASAVALAVLLAAPAALAEIDGHGPDAWRVTGVAAGDRLNARMGPGTRYRVIERFAADARGLIQVTCVPYLTAEVYGQLSAVELKALPPRWCLMRSADLTQAGWVSQRFITPDDAAPQGARSDSPAPHPAREDGEALLRQGEALVQALYAALERAERGKAPDPLDPAEAGRFFTQDFLRRLPQGGAPAPHPLYGTADFDGALTLIARHPQQTPGGGAIVVVADFVNDGPPQKAAFTLQPDPARPGHPLRISGVSHQGWAPPD